MNTATLTATLALLGASSVMLQSQDTPDTGSSKLWEMRKKMQQRSAQRAGSYVEQMNQSLSAGDATGADSALKSAIAQGTLTQAQIDEARGRIEAMVSAQQQAMVAAARAKADAESRAAEAQRMAQAQAAESQGGGRVPSRSPSGSAAAVVTGGKTDPLTPRLRSASRANSTRALQKQFPSRKWGQGNAPVDSAEKIG